ncbi:amidohydrolase family protein [Xanthomonas campestris pv. papavericola]|uniref:Amidohydrolase family protein n=1 Tax=Xanthomonas campestris pv. papavericola TaxID=487881 RepID=A0AAJ2X2S8_XANCA|nr:amidohydrolase family protein [Xanthomonas campestris]MEC3888221.1 amidohydrolase family protein [Xanthomonas campestris pv. papavericola]
MVKVRMSALLVAAGCACTSLSAQAQTTVITAARLLDVQTGRYVERPQIDVVAGRITRVGRQGEPLPPQAQRIDLGERTLLPGLIDMHVHLTVDPTLGGYKGLEYTDNFWTVVGVANAAKTLSAGFTTVRNVGSLNYDDVALKQAIERGTVPGCASPAPVWPMARMRSARRYARCANTAPK